MVQELGDSAVVLAVRPWMNYPDYWNFQTDMLERVKVRFDAEGIGFPFPQRDVHVYYTQEGALGDGATNNESTHEQGSGKS